jgi:cyclic beta-1,2-glucan synthetase
MQRAGVESILGLRQRGDVLELDPCIPRGWPDFEVTLRHRSARYEIMVENPGGACRGVTHAELDGVTLSGNQAQFSLADDGTTHHVRVVLG